jgi:hypothetical protein
VAGIVIAVLTLLLVLASMGYDIDTSTGKVIQNGLILVESQPKKADAYLNGELHSENTPTRFAVPEGTYELRLEKDGYRTWQSNVDVYGSQVNWLNYPLLIPEEINTTTVSKVDGIISFIAQNSSSSQLLTSSASGLNDLLLYDTGSAVPVARKISLPSQLFTSIKGELVGSLKFKEWSDDGRFATFLYSTNSRKYFIIVDLVQPEESIRLSSIFPDDVSNISFSKSKRNTMVVRSNDSLWLVDIGSQQSQQLIVEGVLDFAAAPSGIWVLMDGNGVAYIANALRPTEAVINLDSKPRDILAFDSDGDEVLLVVNDEQVNIFRNLTKSAPAANLPEKVLPFNGSASSIQIAPEGRFLSVVDQSKTTVYDLESRLTYQHQFGSARNVFWLDSHHIGRNDRGQLFISDFNGDNVYQIAGFAPQYGAFINSQKQAIFTIYPNVFGDGKSLRSSSLTLN